MTFDPQITAKYDHCIKIMFYINAWLVSSMVSIANYFLMYSNESHIWTVISFLWWSICFIFYSVLMKWLEEQRAKKEFGWLICGIFEINVCEKYVKQMPYNFTSGGLDFFSDSQNLKSKQDWKIKMYVHGFGHNQTRLQAVTEILFCF